MTRVPWPAPPLSARMRPPWASTSPLQMDRPRPIPPVTGSPSPSPSPVPAYLLNHADRRGLDQRLQVGARPPLVAVRAGVDDGRSSLRCEQQQHLLVLVRELPAIFLPAEEETAGLGAGSPDAVHPPPAGEWPPAAL